MSTSTYWHSKGKNDTYVPFLDEGIQRHRESSTYLDSQPLIFQHFLKWLLGPANPRDSAKASVEDLQTKHRDLNGKVQSFLACMGWKVSDIPLKAALSANKTHSKYDVSTEWVGYKYFLS